MYMYNGWLLGGRQPMLCRCGVMLCCQVGKLKLGKLQIWRRPYSYTSFYLLLYYYLHTKYILGRYVLAVPTSTTQQQRSRELTNYLFTFLLCCYADRLLMLCHMLPALSLPPMPPHPMQNSYHGTAETSGHLGGYEYNEKGGRQIIGLSIPQGLRSFATTHADTEIL